MTQGEDPARGFGILRYVSTCFLAAYCISFTHGLVEFAIGPIQIGQMAGELVDQGFWGAMLWLVCVLARERPDEVFILMTTGWLAFLYLRNRGKLGILSVVLSAIAMGALIFGIYDFFLALRLNTPYVPLPRVLRPMFLGGLFGLLCGTWFWAILHLWLRQRARTNPSLTETFR